MRPLRVRELKSLLEGVPEDALVVTPSFDHSYRDVEAGEATALASHVGSYTEDHGEDITPEAEYGKRIKVFVVR